MTIPCTAGDFYLRLLDGSSILDRTRFHSVNFDVATMRQLHAVSAIATRPVVPSLRVCTASSWNVSELRMLVAKVPLFGVIQSINARIPLAAVTNLVLAHVVNDSEARDA
jgi:hypothetical protein